MKEMADEGNSRRRLTGNVGSFIWIRIEGMEDEDSIGVRM